MVAGERDRNPTQPQVSSQDLFVAARADSFLPAGVFMGTKKVPGNIYLSPWFLREMVILKVPRVIHPYIRVLGYTCGLCSPDIG